MTSHAPLASPGNDEADTLAKVQWLEMVPAGPSGRDVTQWLHCCLLHAGQKVTWSTVKTLGLPVTSAEVQEAYETSIVCLRESSEACGNYWAGGMRVGVLLIW